MWCSVVRRVVRRATRASACSFPSVPSRPVSSQSRGPVGEFIQRGGEWWRLADRPRRGRDRRITFSARPGVKCRGRGYAGGNSPAGEPSRFGLAGFRVRVDPPRTGRRNGRHPVGDSRDTAATHSGNMAVRSGAAARWATRTVPRTAVWSDDRRSVTKSSDDEQRTPGQATAGRAAPDIRAARGTTTEAAQTETNVPARSVGQAEEARHAREKRGARTGSAGRAGEAGRSSEPAPRREPGPGGERIPGSEARNGPKKRPAREGDPAEETRTRRCR